MAWVRDFIGLRVIKFLFKMWERSYTTIRSKVYWKTNFSGFLFFTLMSGLNGLSTAVVIVRTWDQGYDLGLAW